MAYLALIWLHFIGDFILQSDYLAVNKSKSNKILLQHCLMYLTPFLVLGFWLDMPTLALWIVLNLAGHFCVDYVTSRVTSYFWKNEQRHWFFVTIGFDQSLHLTMLFLSTYYLVGV